MHTNRTRVPGHPRSLPAELSTAHGRSSSSNFNLSALSFGYPQPGAPRQVPMSSVVAYPLYVLRRLRAPRAIGAYSVTRG
eukprot:3473414-Rhodomonas_salina.3